TGSPIYKDRPLWRIQMEMQLIATLFEEISRRTLKAVLAIAFGITCLAGQAVHGQTFTTLHGFTGGTDGGYAFAPPILDSAGNLYGTTYQGGDSTCDPANPGRGCGVVYRVDSAGNETVLYSFRTLPDAAFPRAGLVRDSAGN